jgi:hypothetical protein
MSSTVRPAFRFEALRSLISRAGSPPQSTFASPACALHLSVGRSPTRVSALIATSPPRVHLHEHIPSARYVPSSGFLGLSTVCSAVRLAGLFHPAATSRVHARSGASPLAQPVLPSSGRAAPSSFHARTLTGRNRLPHPSTSTPRPCSTRGRVDTRFGVTRAVARSPLRVLVSSGR